MIWLLAQLERENSAGQWFTWVSTIMLIGAVVVLIPVLAGVARRWKQRQLKAIEQDREQRRAGQSVDRVDAWQASAERYVDHDKLTEDDELFSRDDESEYGDDEDGYRPPGNPDGMGSPEENEDRDPFGLFSDKPYQEADDEDGFDEDEDWDEDDEYDEDDEDKTR